MPFRRGHVVALRRNGVCCSGVVWAAQGSSVLVSPIFGGNNPPNHRAEIRIPAVDAHEMGVRLKYPVVRCQTMLRLDVSRLASPEPIGDTPPALMAVVVRSVQAEAQKQAAEARMMYMQVNPSRFAA